MGVKISIATAVKRHGWVSRDTYKDYVRREFLQNYPTIGGHIRIDEDELLRLINGRSPVRYEQKPRPTAGEMARAARRRREARAKT